MLAAPRACGVHDDRSFENAPISRDTPYTICANEVRKASTFVKARAEPFGLAFESQCSAKWQRGSVTSRDETPDAVRGNRRKKVAQFAAIDHFLVVEADRTQLCRTLTQRIQVCLAFRHLDMAMALEAA